MIRVLFVCLGNICRSPLAEGVFRSIVEAEGRANDFEIDSAGTGNWHIGEPPDTRAQAAALMRDIDIAHQRGRQIHSMDFARFDHIVAMDHGNLRALALVAPENPVAKLGLLLEHAPGLGVEEVPDPYYGGSEGFDHALDLIEAGARGFLKNLK